VQRETRALRRLGGLQSLGDVAPVDDLPDVVHVIRADILVLKIVRMLPDIDPQERDETSGALEGVLVGTGGDHKAVVGLVISWWGEENERRMKRGTHPTIPSQSPEPQLWQQTLSFEMSPGIRTEP
jgi:hypothetical protein